MLVMNAIPNKAIFEEVAQNLGVNESFVEKDWYAVQVISVLSQLHFPDIELVFSGGTCLSKAHHLIKRFSEDIDFRVVANHNSLRKTDRSNFKNSIAQSLRNAGFIIPDGKITARNENRFFAIYIEYNSIFPSAEALRADILLEVTFDSPALASIKLPIHSFTSAAMKQPPEVIAMRCISPIEIAADKLSALAWRIPERVHGQNDDPTLVRHLHDIAALEEVVRGNADLSRLIKSSFDKDNRRAKTNLQFSSLSMSEKIEQLLHILITDKIYPQEYEKFVRGVSYASEELIIGFDEAVECLRRLTSSIHA